MERGGAAQTQRILWIDAVRGVTISLVVLLHAAVVLVVWFPAVESGPLEPVMKGIQFLRLVRMPAFFFCSGLVFSFAIVRGWSWFLRRRMRFALWVVTVWTGISLAVEAAGLHLYPQSATPFVQAGQLFWVPYGNLWFIYAMLSVSALALVLRPLPLPVQHLAVLLIGLAAMSVDNTGLPAGLRLLAGGLAQDALVFFMLGVWWGPALVRLFDNRRAALAALFILPAAGVIILRQFTPAGIWLPVLVMLPMTVGFLAAIRILSGWQPGARLFAAIGRRSLEVFLLHQFFLAATFALLRHAFPGIGPVAALPLLWLAPLAASMLAARVLRGLTGSILFDAPGWLVWPFGRARAQMAAG